MHADVRRTANVELYSLKVLYFIFIRNESTHVVSNSALSFSFFFLVFLFFFVFIYLLFFSRSVCVQK